MYRNSQHAYGLISIASHWLSALAIIGLFALGVWMVELDYYSKWYQTGPDVHRGVGVLLFFVLLLRLIFRIFDTLPQFEPTIKHWKRVLALAMHRVLYLVTLLVITSGYMISTTDGQPVDVFGWFNVPATITSIDYQEELFGDIHYYSAYVLLILAGVHTAAALKHHFVDRDATLKKMLGISR